MMTNKKAIDVLNSRLRTLADAKNAYREGSFPYMDINNELEATLKAVRALEDMESETLAESQKMSDE